MNEFKVGSRYDFLSGNERALFSIDDSGLNLTIKMRDPDDKEVKGIKDNTLKYFIKEIDGVIWLVWNFIGTITLDSPYCSTLSESKPKLEEPENNEGYGLTIMLGNSRNGELKAIRYVGLSNKFSRELKKLVDNQKDFNKEEYYSTVRDQMIKYSTNDIKDRATVYGKSSK